MVEMLTTGEVARRISEQSGIAVFDWQIRRLYDRGDLPRPQRFGQKLIHAATDIPEIIAAMVRRGWLPA